MDNMPYHMCPVHGKPFLGDHCPLCFPEPKKTVPVTEADANLRAAAPDLLEALESIVNDPESRATYELQHKAYKALAKARGE